MFVPFEKLAASSRIWVYQANRTLTASEEAQTAAVLESFCNQWSAHGTPLMSSCRIEHHQFLMLAVDEAWTNASGCSIDGSVRVLKTLQEELGIDFFDRTSAAFLIGNSVKMMLLKDIKAALAQGTLNPASLTFNTLIATVDQYSTSWIIPMERTWLARYLPKTAIA